MSGQFPQSLGLLAGMAFCLAPALPAAAQPAPATAPATAPAQGAALDVVVLEVKGTVQASTDDGKTWTPAKPGMHLTQGASFRTGFHSSVTCGIAPDQGFTLESLGTVRVEEAIKKGKHFKTDLVMKYGATNYSIESGGTEHETTIRTPGSTLSVRGTVVRVTDRPGFSPTAESFTGRAVFKTARGITSVGSKGGKYAHVSADDSDAAQAALNQTFVDPAAALARTTTDVQLIAQQVSLGGLVSFDNRENITIVRDSAPESNAELLQSLPDTLVFVLRWNGNAALNLVEFDEPETPADVARGLKLEHTPPPPLGDGFTPTAPLSNVNLGQIGLTRAPLGFQPTELLFPGFGLNISPTGGVIPYANRGGPSGGTEVAYWTGAPPPGIYAVSVNHQSGPPVTYSVSAFLDGSPLYINYSSSLQQGNVPGKTIATYKSFTVTGTVTGGFNDLTSGGSVFVPPNPFLENLIHLGNGSNVPIPFAVTASAAHGVKAANSGHTVKPVTASVPPMGPAPQATPVHTR